MRTNRTIGILGGGQLGRMLALAAAFYGVRVIVYCANEEECASFVASKTIVASYNDEQALRAFSAQVDVITSEWENVPAKTLDFLRSLGRRVHPKPDVFRIAQDRVLEKERMNEVGLKTARYAAVSTEEECVQACARIGLPAILKTRFGGYDGKGQARIKTVEEAVAAWRALKCEPCILEEMLAFQSEASIIVARDQDGVMQCFPPVKNVHEDGILRTSTYRLDLFGGPPNWARMSEGPRRLAEHLGVVGLLAVELFLMPDGTLRGNEVAPRPHNSGHWTIEGTNVSQFSQLVRVLLGLPLLPVKALWRHVEMHNLLNEEADEVNVRDYYKDPHTHVHLYDKGPPQKPSDRRKRGHLTKLLG